MEPAGVILILNTEARRWDWEVCEYYIW